MCNTESGEVAGFTQDARRPEVLASHPAAQFVTAPQQSLICRDLTAHEGQQIADRYLKRCSPGVKARVCDAFTYAEPRNVVGSASPTSSMA
jgi:hypothetical protein